MTSIGLADAKGRVKIPLSQATFTEYDKEKRSHRIKLKILGLFQKIHEGKHEDSIAGIDVTRVVYTTKSAKKKLEIVAGMINCAKESNVLLAYSSEDQLQFTSDMQPVLYVDSLRKRDKLRLTLKNLIHFWNPWVKVDALWMENRGEVYIRKDIHKQNLEIDYEKNKFIRIDA